MKKVILLRHAKSSWDDPQRSDHDRPLNRRGRAAAPVIGNWLRDRGHIPDTVLSSSSLRTRQTVLRLREAIPNLAFPVVERALYHATPDAMRDRLAALPSTCQTILLVGHQPGLSALTRKLSNGAESRRCKRAYEHFPTAAAAVLEVEIDDWSALACGSARFVDFAKPRELAEAAPGVDRRQTSPTVPTAVTRTDPMIIG